MRKRLSGKTALITGASSGIGRACAVLLARHGARLVLTGRRREALEETRAAAGQGTVMAADLADPADLARFCESVAQDCGQVDILLLNAGIGIHAPAYDTAPEAAERLMQVNFLAPVEMTRRLLPIVPRGGTVAAVSSVAGKVSLPRMSVYCASKHALNAYLNALRMETRERAIHVLAVCPGYVRTPFASNLIQGAASDPRPPRRFAITAEQCAAAVLRGILKRKRTVVVPRSGWILAAAERLFPAALHRLLAGVTRSRSRR